MSWPLPRPGASRRTSGGRSPAHARSHVEELHRGTAHAPGPARQAGRRVPRCEGPGTRAGKSRALGGGSGQRGGTFRQEQPCDMDMFSCLSISSAS